MNNQQKQSENLGHMLVLLQTALGLLINLVQACLCLNHLVVPARRQMQTPCPPSSSDNHHPVENTTRGCLSHAGASVPGPCCDPLGLATLRST